ncbi:hypothetical protein APHAL10511_004122 [Amanita phalloides]|nr:hypothetical protein APHAL10511_004122 [Amanita phalloides]
MSPVQSKVFPLLPQLAMVPQPNPDPSEPNPARDLLVKAKTGTGKTLAFLVPAVEARLRAIEQHAKKTLRDSGLVSDRALEAKAKRAFAQQRVGTLVISPTRELATQIANEALRLTSHHTGFEVKLLVGGESRNRQVRDWRHGRRDLVVATPGRLRDLLSSENDFSEAFKHAQLLVLDEADSLLDMGFRDDIEDITSYLPRTPDRQTFLFSATISPAIRQIARQTLAKDHLFIDCVNEDDAPVHTHIKQYHTVLPTPAHQLTHILRLLAHEQLTNPGASKTIVFLPTTKMTQLYATLLQEIKDKVLPAGRWTRIYEIHSKRTMESRTSTSADFRADKSGCSILVSSDVSARGVDYPGVTRIIQVGIPMTGEQYVHRIGRTGRSGPGGRQGRGDLVLLPWEMGFVTWQLRDMPLKPLTTAEMERQVKELAEKLDEEPRAYFGAHSPKVQSGADKSSFQSRGGFGKQGRERAVPTGPSLFVNAPYAPVSDRLETSVEELRADMDTQAVEETFMSMLGYYLARTEEMRTDKETVVAGCKDWSMDAGGLQRAPTISPMMMERLGLTGGGRSGGRGGGRGGHSGRPGRGFGLRVKNEERSERVKEWEWREGRQSQYGEARRGQGRGGEARRGQDRGGEGRGQDRGGESRWGQDRGGEGGRGQDRGRAQADWRDRERTIQQKPHWLSRGRSNTRR